jgi:hypothetical protein
MIRFHGIGSCSGFFCIGRIFCGEPLHTRIKSGPGFRRKMLQTAADAIRQRYIAVSDKGKRGTL